MKFLLFHMHWYNRGDEAANRAMIDALLDRYEDCKISIPLYYDDKSHISVLDNENIEVWSSIFPRRRDFVEIVLMILTRGKITLSSTGKKFLKEIFEADMVIHCPGGPSIGDTYKKVEWAYLLRLLLVKRLNKPYYFYAPSMGPFYSKFRNIIRKYLLKNATGVVLREDISGKYVKELLPRLEYKVTLDSAFQNDIHEENHAAELVQYKELNDFLNNNEKIIGITVTDLLWNPLHKGDVETEQRIKDTFSIFINKLVKEGYGVLFIPQLFGIQNDYDYMDSFSTDGTFLMSDKYDSYFQQYIISKMYAVVGMRYHSNIFSCKMRTPFISISYEQKMLGFMTESKLNDYCIDINDLCIDELNSKFDLLIKNYAEYKDYLNVISKELKQKSANTTEYLFDIVQNK